MAEQVGAVMVVGDGIGSVRASLDLANMGFRVHLVEPHPILGGQMPAPSASFPTNDCEMCFLGPEIAELQRHPNIEILFPSELINVEGEAGRFTAKVHCQSTSQTRIIREIPVGAVILAPNHKPFDATSRPELGYGRFANVVTSMDFDRILATRGSVAWLQCVGSRDRDHNYCSAVCCLEATKKAMMAMDYQPGSQHHIFLMDMRAFGKGYMDYYNRARHEYGIQYTRCRIAAVTEDPATKELVLRYETETGELEEKRFQLVVLSIGMEVQGHMSDLARRLGLELNEHGFVATMPFAPVRTSRPGIFVCGPLSQPRDTHDTVTQASAAAAEAAALLTEARGTLARVRQYPPERDVSGQAPRIGVFFSECGFGPGIDIFALRRYAETLPGVVHASDDRTAKPSNTCDRIRAKIQELELNRIVVVCGTPHIYEESYRETLREAGLNTYLLEIVNLREQCTWVHQGDAEGMMAKARDLLRMGVARAALLEPLHPIEVDVVPAALVLGGGVSGMNAALSLANQKYQVYLVEREAQLGGNLRHIHYDLDGKDVQSYLRSLITVVENHPRIAIMRETELLAVEGSVGNFVSRLRSPRGEMTIRHGALIVATGGQENRVPDYSLGQHPRVITQRDLEQRIVNGDPTVAAAKEIVMIQCVGPAEEYCSRLCCSAALKNALKIKQLNPAANIYIVYKDIRAYGFREQYYTAARDAGVVFLRYDDAHLPQVELDDGLTVQVREFLLGRDIRFHPDLLVLSEGMSPAEGSRQLAELLHVPLNANGFFVEAHPKLRPADLAVDGLYLCGIAHNPKSIEESIAQAQAAAARAATILSRPKIAVGGPVAVVDQQKCVGCLTCIRICPYDAPHIRPDKSGVGAIAGAAEIDVARCRGCGLCAGECPAKAIQLLNWRDEQILAMITAVPEPVGA